VLRLRNYIIVLLFILTGIQSYGQGWKFVRHEVHFGVGCIQFFRRFGRSERNWHTWHKRFKITNDPTDNYGWL
jgi:hypothetical protein